MIFSLISGATALTAVSVEHELRCRTCEVATASCDRGATATEIELAGVIWV